MAVQLQECKSVGENTARFGLITSGLITSGLNTSEPGVNATPACLPHEEIETCQRVSSSTSKVFHYDLEFFKVFVYLSENFPSSLATTIRISESKSS